MDYTLYAECEEDFLDDYQTIAHQVIEAVFLRFPPPKAVQLSLYIVDEEAIRKINRTQRKLDRPTDVLSFPNLLFSQDHAGDFSRISCEAFDSTDPQSGELILGEIVICAKKVYEQAAAYGHDPKREFAFLLAHSMLHLLGYDHEDQEQEERMFALQEEILKEAGYER